MKRFLMLFLILTFFLGGCNQNENKNHVSGKIETANAYASRGRIKFELEDSKGALLDFNKAIELNPENAVAYYNRAIVKASLKDNAGAIQDFKKSQELNPLLFQAR